MTPIDLCRRLERLEAGPTRPRSVQDMTDEELIDGIGLGEIWPTLTEPERDRMLQAMIAHRTEPGWAEMTAGERDEALHVLAQEIRA